MMFLVLLEILPTIRFRHNMNESSLEFSAECSEVSPEAQPPAQRKMNFFLMKLEKAQPIITRPFPDTTRPTIISVAKGPQDGRTSRPTKAPTENPNRQTMIQRLTTTPARQGASFPLAQSPSPLRPRSSACRFAQSRPYISTAPGFLPPSPPFAQGGPASPHPPLPPAPADPSTQ